MSTGDKAFHFLVVDDDEEARKTVVEYLRAMGHAQITEAADGSQAIQALEANPTINFVISDWDMPVVNGLTLLQRVKSNTIHANLPFLICTSPISHEAEKVMLAAESLVDGYLIKPFRSQALKEKIDKILGVVIRGPQKQVLLVDDDPDAREMVNEYLKQLGFKDIRVLSDGKAALEYLSLNASKVGLVVSDWEMPELNGIELLRACKGNPALEGVPFLMITSQSSIESMKVVQAAKANVDQYLLKPFNLGEMRERIEALVEKARTRNEVQVMLLEANDKLESKQNVLAKRLLEDVLKLDPDNDTALRQLGEITTKSKGMEAALPLFKKAVERNPYSQAAYVRLAAAYEQLNRIDRAIALLETANHHINFSSELHFLLGKLYNKKGLESQAQDEFEKTLAIQLDHQEARLMLELIKKRNPT